MTMMTGEPITTSPVEMTMGSVGMPRSLPYAADGSNDASIVHNIASFLTLSDAASLVAMSSADLHQQQQQQQHDFSMMSTEPHISFVDQPDVSPADSWAVGLEYEGQSAFSSSWSIATPPTPALVALSPGATPVHPDDEMDPMDRHYNDDGNDDDSSHMRRVLQIRTRRWASSRLAIAIFSHPGSLRSYCLDAYRAAQEIRARQQEMNKVLASSSSEEEEDEAPETRIYPTKNRSSKSKRKKQTDPRLDFVHEWVDTFIMENIPLSVVLDLLQATGGLSVETAWASLTITDRTIHAVMHALAKGIHTAWESILHVLQNPRHYAGAIITMQFNAVERTSGAFATGLHSVASVGSASSRALIHRWSHANLSSATAIATAPVTTGAALHSLKAQTALLRKLSNINDVAEVVAYQEVCDDTGGLTKQAIHRTRRMMHYSVSLRPFVATVAIPHASRHVEEIEELNVADVQSVAPSESDEDDGDEDTSPFMCTPQSFPPTPHSRQRVLMSKQRRSNDIVFAARDKLRIHGALSSEDERTREAARLLSESKSLAVFLPPSQEDDIELSCGNHVATKRGSTVYYSTTRSVVPLWRNACVYFEMYVLPHMIGGGPPLAMPTLSVGLSTQEMPPNTLVGTWQGSVGIYTTGQVLLSGQWFSPQGESPQSYGYSDGGVVGVLVFMDEGTANETWDGLMITAGVTFSVNGRVVPPAAPAQAKSVASPPPSSKVNDDRNEESLSSSSSGSSSSCSEPKHPTVFLTVPAAEDVFPTVTLQSTGTAVMCRFSSEDLLATSRSMIGASPDVPIYAIDGSVINLE